MKPKAGTLIRSMKLINLEPNDQGKKRHKLPITGGTLLQIV